MGERSAIHRLLLSITASFQYDAVGQRKSKTINGATTHFLYDGLKCLTQVTFADSSTVQYTYDAGNQVTQSVGFVNGAITGS